MSEKISIYKNIMQEQVQAAGMAGIADRYQARRSSAGPGRSSGRK